MATKKGKPAAKKPAGKKTAAKKDTKKSKKVAGAGAFNGSNKRTKDMKYKYS